MRGRGVMAQMPHVFTVLLRFSKFLNKLVSTSGDFTLKNNFHQLKWLFLWGESLPALPTAILEGLTLSYSFSYINVISFWLDATNCPLPGLIFFWACAVRIRMLTVITALCVSSLDLRPFLPDVGVRFPYSSSAKGLNRKCLLLPRETCHKLNPYH